jgi:hypothetical protein
MQGELFFFEGSDDREALAYLLFDSRVNRALKLLLLDPHWKSGEAFSSLEQPSSSWLFLLLKRRKKLSP